MSGANRTKIRLLQEVLWQAWKCLQEEGLEAGKEYLRLYCVRERIMDENGCRLVDPPPASSTLAQIPGICLCLDAPVPTKPGHYWARSRRLSQPVVMVRVERHGSGKTARLVGVEDGRSHLLAAWDRWSTRIEELVTL